MNITRHLASFAREQANRPALEYYGRTWTFAEVLAEVDGVREAILRAGVRAGDRIGIWHADLPRCLFTYLAVVEIEATALVLDPSWRAAELGPLLAGPLDVLLHDAELGRWLHALPASGACQPLECGADGLPSASRIRRALGDAPVPPEGGHDAMLVPTSGTSGVPSLVRLSHENVVANLTMLRARIGAALEPGDVFLNFLPLSHNYGLLGATLLPWSLGCRVVLRRSFAPLETLGLLAQHEVACFAGVPAVYAMLAPLPVPDGPLALKAACCGSDFLPPELAVGFQERYGVPIVEGYSLTEATLVTTMNHLDDARVGSVGPALDGLDLEIVGAHGVPVGAGQPGEIAIRGATVMRGYWGDGGETGKRLRDGWLYTGDLGTLDAHGHLRILGRERDLIVVGGEKVFPAEVERVCRTHAGVLDAAVVGVADPLLGQRAVACVAMRPGASLDRGAFLDRCASSLARYKVPSDVIVLDQIPRGPAGKLLRAALRARLAAAPARDR